MTTEVLTEQQNPPGVKPESQVRVQFTTKLKDFNLSEDTGPILVPTSKCANLYIQIIL